ncbi:MAG: hypothetical protein U0798_08525 [Gemmataceae bacterium]
MKNTEQLDRPIHQVTELHLEPDEHNQPNEPVESMGDHPGGLGVLDGAAIGAGIVCGGACGAAAGFAINPAGMALGAVVGAAAGGLVGMRLASLLDPTADE